MFEVSPTGGNLLKLLSSFAADGDGDSEPGPGFLNIINLDRGFSSHLSGLAKPIIS